VEKEIVDDHPIRAWGEITGYRHWYRAIPVSCEGELQRLRDRGVQGGHPHCGGTLRHRSYRVPHRVIRLFSILWSLYGHRGEGRWSNLFVRNRLNGGGGGNRTHVRRHVCSRHYMLSPSLLVSLPGTPQGGNPGELSRFNLASSAREDFRCQSVLSTPLTALRTKDHVRNVTAQLGRHCQVRVGSWFFPAV